MNAPDSPAAALRHDPFVPNTWDAAAHTPEAWAQRIEAEAKGKVKWADLVRTLAPDVALQPAYVAAPAAAPLLPPFPGECKPVLLIPAGFDWAQADGLIDLLRQVPECSLMLPAGEAAPSGLPNALEHASADGVGDTIARALWQGRWPADAPAQNLIVDASVYGAAGADAVQELAGLLAHLRSIVGARLAAGEGAADVAQTLPIQLQSDGHWLLACAKLWAARALWADYWQAQGLAADQLPACPLRVVPVPYLLFASDVENNLVRLTLQTSAAMLAGAQQVALCSYFPAGSPYTAEGLRLALTQYLVLRHESQLGTMPEPLQGAYALIDLAHQLMTAARAQAVCLPVELAAWPEFLRAGSWQAAIATQAEARRQAFASQTDVWVGGNRFLSADAVTASLEPADASGPDFPRLVPLHLA